MTRPAPRIPAVGEKDLVLRAERAGNLDLTALPERAVRMDKVGGVDLVLPVVRVVTVSVAVTVVVKVRRSTRLLRPLIGMEMEQSKPRKWLKHPGM